MQVTYDNNKSTLIRGRAGELADRCNLQTAELIIKIFSYNGPYRQTLKDFSLICKDIAKDYIVYKDGIIYTDLDLENQIIWGNYPYELILNNNQVIQKFRLKGSLFLFIKKLLKDIDVFINIDKYMEIAEEKYKQFSDDLEKAYSNKKATILSFLESYKSIVYISYLYETLFAYNGPITSKEYTTTWDFILNDKEVAEKYYIVPNGFYIGDDIEIKDISSNKPFIPNKIPDLKNTNKLKAAQLKLQCLKNNLRLKTGCYLYFVNIGK